MDNSQILGLLINIGCCIAISLWAKNKGYSFIFILITGIILTPLASLIITALLKPTSSQAVPVSPQDRKCDMCDKENVALHYVKIEDDTGTQFRYVCGDCFGKYNCTPVTPPDVSAEDFSAK